MTEITSGYAASAFVWTRDTGNAAADATWNAAHNGVKQFTMNAADLTENVKLTCTLTGTSPDYGTVYVDEDMNLIHAPAEADANDTLHLENGILSVETEGNEYQLNGNVLGVVRHRLNGSVTAEAWVYTAAPEKLVEFKYDSNGLRTQKKVTDHGQTVTTDYIYHSKKLVGLTCGNDTLHFFYDAQNRPAQVEYGGEVYTYIHNIQGDITEIRDRAGNSIATFHYDAWGACLNERENSSDTIKQQNPFGYRGYVYDVETGLYNLPNRCYSPSQGRFYGFDALLGKVGTASPHNVFAYCGNNPIAFFDPDGNSAVVVTAGYFSTKALLVGLAKALGAIIVTIGGASIIDQKIQSSQSSTTSSAGQAVSARSIVELEAALTTAVYAHADARIQENDAYYFAFTLVDPPTGYGYLVYLDVPLTQIEAQLLLGAATVLESIQSKYGFKDSHYGIYTDLQTAAYSLSVATGGPSKVRIILLPIPTRGIITITIMHMEKVDRIFGLAQGNINSNGGI